MAEKSNIEWTDHTFNPWIGCTRVSAACDHCYAEAWDRRFNGQRWGPHAPRTRTSPANWAKPITWNRNAAARGVRQRVFCASLADVFDNHRTIMPSWRADLWALIRRTPSLDWLLLTKRPQNIARYLPADWGAGWPHVWLGTTVEDQTRAEANIPPLLAIPAAVRFVSVEPMLGPVDLTRIDLDGETELDALTPDSLGRIFRDGWQGCNATPAEDLEYFVDWYGSAPTETPLPRLHWVICGGESGPRARPMHPDWARSLRDQCRAAGVAFFFKQWGEWFPGEIDNPADGSGWIAYPEIDHDPGADARMTGRVRFETINLAGGSGGGGEGMLRVGKARAGRMLDGRIWSEMPG